MNIPEQYLPVMPYLILKNATSFKAFMQTVFDAREQLIVPVENSELVRHGELRVGDAVIMFADANDDWGQKTSGLFIYVPGVDETYQKAIDNGAKSLMHPARQEYGYAAGFQDPFGNDWWLS